MSAACEHGIEFCGQLRMRSEQTESGLTVSFTLVYCPRHATKQVEDAALQLISSVGELARVIGQPEAS